MLDVVYPAAAIVLFALVAVIAKGVERLGPDSPASTPREARGGGEKR